MRKKQKRFNGLVFVSARSSSSISQPCRPSRAPHLQRAFESPTPATPWHSVVRTMAACASLSAVSLRGSLVVRAHAGCGHDHSPASVGVPGKKAKVPLRAAAPKAGRTILAVAVDSPDLVEAFLDGLKYDDKGLVVAIAQDVDTGAVLMQGFADRTAVRTTLTAKKATFFSRSRQQQWTKGETSGNFIAVKSVHVDCDKDSLIYMGVPDGPTCHTGAHTCYYSRVDGTEGAAAVANGGARDGEEEAFSTLYELEATIKRRGAEVTKEGDKPSWTKRLLDNPELLCSKVREEAGELCESWENEEGKERAASEMADVLYHAMVLLNLQGVEMEDVMAVLRNRFGTSGVEEKAARPPKK